MILTASRDSLIQDRQISTISGGCVTEIEGDDPVLSRGGLGLPVTLPLAPFPRRDWPRVGASSERRYAIESEAKQHAEGWVRSPCQWPSLEVAGAKR